MKYYPVGLDIKNKKCVVIGGGDVAERKALKLLDYGADVCVVSPALTPHLKQLAGEDRIRHIHADYQADHLAGAFLVIGATDRPDVNEQISQDARARSILINIVDDPPECDFILPALLERGDLVIAILTGGNSPSLAKKLRLELEPQFGPEYETFLRIMGAVRQKVLAKGLPFEENKEIFEAIVNSDMLKLIKYKRWDVIKSYLKRTTGEDIEVGV
ncbi:MAG: bifunctional precorrin-2 dehydrogenase/sirohydrochlorin ferrochelatase [Deltaproteobacteria bacterium]|nr:bifunctional precorrin-2 dehydrogenase/sirohydrochlorin ferrochelatase [Deltaproteobacteria bacterium]